MFVECQLIFQVIHALSRTRVLHVWVENVVASQFLVPPYVEIHLSSIICHIKDKNHTRIQIKRHHLSTYQLFLWFRSSFLSYLLDTIGVTNLFFWPISLKLNTLIFTPPTSHLFLFTLFLFSYFHPSYFLLFFSSYQTQCNSFKTIDSTKYLKYIGSRPNIKKYCRMKTFPIDVIIKKTFKFMMERLLNPMFKLVGRGCYCGMKDVSTL